MQQSDNFSNDYMTTMQIQRGMKLLATSKPEVKVTKYNSLLFFFTKVGITRSALKHLCKIITQINK